jgi:hypothetical protein
MGASKQAATPRPWRTVTGPKHGGSMVWGETRLVARCTPATAWRGPTEEEAANADLIVDAVNAYEDLVEFVTAVAKYAKTGELDAATLQARAGYLVRQYRLSPP